MTPRASFNSIQTQALASLLATRGTYVSMDVREIAGGAIAVTTYYPAFNQPTVYRIAPDGETRELAEVPA